MSVQLLLLLNNSGNSGSRSTPSLRRLTLAESKENKTVATVQHRESKLLEKQRPKAKQKKIVAGANCLITGAKGSSGGGGGTTTLREVQNFSL